MTTDLKVSPVDGAWHRNPVFVLIWALPAAAVIAGVATLLIALEDADRALPASYHWEGARLDEDFERARRAALGSTCSGRYSSTRSPACNSRSRAHGSPNIPVAPLCHSGHASTASAAGPRRCRRASRAALRAIATVAPCCNSSSISPRQPGSAVANAQGMLIADGDSSPRHAARTGSGRRDGVGGEGRARPELFPELSGTWRRGTR